MENKFDSPIAFFLKKHWNL